MTDVEKCKRDLMNEIYKLNRRIDGLMNTMTDLRNANAALQGKIATVAGRMEMRR